ncbi:MAG TPA: tetratricopeptide repeat protein [Polyangia bacterium]|nr:tetratricopeptide repeat protein [Polyangia bacterium]
MSALLLLLAMPAHAGKAEAEAHYKKGTAHYYLGQFEAAIAEFEAGYTEDPRPGFLYNLAQAHRKAGRPALALDFYRKYLELEPRSPRRQEVMGRVAELERQLAAAPAAPVAPVDHPAAPVNEGNGGSEAPSAPAREPSPAPAAPPAPNLLPAPAPPPVSSPGEIPAAAMPAETPREAKAPPPARKRWRVWVAVAAAGVAAVGGATVGGVLGSQASQAIPLLPPVDAR